MENTQKNRIGRIATAALAGALALGGQAYAQGTPKAPSTSVMTRTVADDFARDYFIHNQTLIKHELKDENNSCAKISFERAPVGERYGLDFRNNDIRIDLGFRDNNALESEHHGLVQLNTSFGYVGATHQDMFFGEKQSFIGRLNLDEKVSVHGTADTKQNSRVLGLYDSQNYQVGLLGGNTAEGKPVLGASLNNNSMWGYVRATPDLDARFEFGSIPHARTNIAFNTTDTGLHELYTGSETFWFNTGRFAFLNVPNVSLGKESGSVAGQVRYQEDFGDKLTGKLYVRAQNNLYVGGEAWHRFTDEVSGGAIETGLDVGRFHLKGRVEHDSNNEWYGGIMMEVRL